MDYLPCNNSILVAGGRNDSLSQQNMTPFLNDLVLFLLDQKVWLHVMHVLYILTYLALIFKSSVNLLDVGEDDLRVESSAADHFFHVIPGNEVGDSGISSEMLVL